VTLPPLPVTVARTAPLVAGPPPVLPPLPGRRRVSGPDVAPVAGTVTGLARVQPQVPEPPAAPGPVAAEPARAMVHRKARSGPAPTPAAMVEATGGYVGEAREPVVPHRAPGWMRYVPEWLNQGDQSTEPAPPAPKPKPVLPPSKVVETTLADSAPPVHPTRRPNLGQSRRLGLGAPIKPAEPASEPAVATPEPATPARPPGLVDEEPPLRHPRTTDPASAPPPLVFAPHEPSATDSAAAPPDHGTAPASATGSHPGATASHPGATASHPGATASYPGATSVSGTWQVRPTAAPDSPASGPPPLTYRATPGRAKPQPAAPPTSHVAVPPDLASALRKGTHVDVSAIPVHRGPEASAEARALGARAFTRGGEVFLPAEAGPLDSPRARGLLAHELVHAVQQRTLGPTLPSPDSAAGQALEAEAVAVEHAHSAPLVHPSLPQVLGRAARTTGVQLAPLAPQTIEPPQPRVLDEWTAPEPERNEQAPDDAALELAALAGMAPAGPVFDHAAQDDAVSAQVLQVINVERTAAGQPPLTTLDAPTVALVRDTVAEQHTEAAVCSMIFARAVAEEPTVRQPAAPPAEPVVPPPPVPVATPPAPAPAATTTTATPDTEPIELDRLDLEALATRLYDRLRSRIRMELLIDRERAGLLTDFR
jgi:hypothetical protein